MHRTLAQKNPLLILLLDPEIPAYKAFASRGIRESVIELDNSKFSHLKDELRLIFNKVSPDTAWKLHCEILKIIDEKSFLKTEVKTDSRILKVAEIIRTNLPERINIEDLTQNIQLSGDRLIKLFKEQMGIPLRRYLLWSRIRTSLDFIKKGYSLTDAAHEAGFSDAAHMSRTFKENFGFTPSSFFSKTSDIEVIFC